MQGRPLHTSGSVVMWGKTVFAAAVVITLVILRPCASALIVLHYRASNVPPYPFEWIGLEARELDYGAILTRITREYDRRFRAN
jgi:hypothetical protein